MRRVLAGAALVLALAGCGSALPGVLDALPDELGGHERADQSLGDDGRLAAALDAEGLATNAITGSEIRWGDDIRLVALRFEAVGLNEAGRVAQALLGIEPVDARIGVLGNQSVIELAGPDIDAVAYVLNLSGNGGETLMYAIVAPSSAEAEVIVDAIIEANPRSE